MNQPITENGLPYSFNGPHVYIKDGSDITLNLYELRRWKNLGVTSITLPFGTLTAQDLITLTK